MVKLVYIPLVDSGWLEQAHCDGVASVVVVAGDMDEAVEAAVLTDEVAVVRIGDGDGDSNKLNGEIPYKMMLHYSVLIIGKIRSHAILACMGTYVYYLWCL